jgi:hypothetical protein
MRSGVFRGCRLWWRVRKSSLISVRRGSKVLTRFLARLPGTSRAQVVLKKGSEHEIILMDGCFMYKVVSFPTWIVRDCGKDVRIRISLVHGNARYWARMVIFLGNRQ